MVEMLMRVFAFAVLAGFLAILVYRLGRVDIAVVVGVTLLMAGWDLFVSSRRS
ncbi:MAG: hypothetical protein Q4F71_00810 [Paracoccus sp. (in: a-proteobacteria)]|nr:hypothetical protein [Paracoccus sp. (in: a-proteobacteria)]